MLIKCPKCSSTKTKMVSKSRKLYQLQCIDCGGTFSISYDDVSELKRKQRGDLEGRSPS